MELEFLGVTAAKKAQFSAKGIDRVEDLLNFLPKGYRDCRATTGILDESQYSVIFADIDSCSRGFGTKTDVITLKGHEAEAGTPVKFCWFGSKINYRYSILAGYVKKRVLVCGKFKFDPYFKGFTSTTPDIFTDDIPNAMKLYPEYKKIPGMAVEYLNGKMELALRTPAVNSEVLPLDILQRYDLLTMPEAYKCIHTPKSDSDIQNGDRRVLYNDLIYFALRREWAARDAIAGSQYGIKSMSLYKKILASFPYALTGDQQKVINAMIEQVKDRRRLHTLIQGDVGSGKTICAFLMAAAFIGSGYQAAVMAPTQVLAEQHYNDAVKLFEPFGVKVVILNSKMSAAEKRGKLAAIKDGSAGLIIGTHSVFGKGVEYKTLALTVADEEHRFGVAQRAALVAKAAEGCHSITMSATPIPRTIAQSIYGETVDVQEIKEKPAGRMQVKTYMASVSRRNEIYESVEGQLKRGHQAYVICPKIEKGEDTTGLLSVEETAAAYKEHFSAKGYIVETLTGKTSEADTQKILSDFNAGAIHILVSTTVVEVGVNVPNATIMVITNAERFGLSGLHQLRGRVGRGSAQGHCILEYSAVTEKSLERLRTIKANTDGYLIALEDLKQRGAGDLIGTQQHGENKYVSLMLMYKDDYEIARKIAAELLDTDAECEMVDTLKREMLEAE